MNHSFKLFFTGIAGLVFILSFSALAAADIPSVTIPVNASNGSVYTNSFTLTNYTTVNWQFGSQTDNSFFIITDSNNNTIVNSRSTGSGCFSGNSGKYTINAYGGDYNTQGGMRDGTLTGSVSYTPVALNIPSSFKLFDLQFNLNGIGGYASAADNQFMMYFPTDYGNSSGPSTDQPSPLGQNNSETINSDNGVKVYNYPITITYEVWFDGSASNNNDNPSFQISSCNSGGSLISNKVSITNWVNGVSGYKMGTYTIPPGEGIIVTLDTGSYWVGGIGWTGTCSYTCEYKITYHLDQYPPPVPTGISVCNPTTIEGKIYTKDSPVTLTWTSETDPNDPNDPEAVPSGIKYYTINCNDRTYTTTANSWTDYKTSTQNYLFSSDGPYTVTITAMDLAGNTSGSTSYTFILDTTPPTGTMAINQTCTNSTTVTLSLSQITDNGGSGVSQVGFSNDNSTYTWYTYTPDLKTVSWSLSAGDGPKTVYMKLKDQVGNETSNTDAVPAKIILDTTPPTGAITINGGATTTNNNQVRLNLAATDATSGVALMQFSNDGTNFSAAEPYATTKAWTLSSTGTNTVYVEYIDAAGNVSAPIPSVPTITYNNTPPSNLPDSDISTLPNSEEWSTAYPIYGQVIVPVGVTLTIDAGVTVTVSGPPDTDPNQNGLIVYGTLIVNSGATFTTSDLSWMGIIISGTSASATVADASINLAQRGIAAVDGAVVSVSGCTFSQNFAGIHAYNSQPVVTGCIFLQNTYGIKEDDGAGASVDGTCTFTGNKVNYYHADGTVDLGSGE